MPRIEVDDEVYAAMEKLVQGFEQPNDVLRRVLLKGQPGTGAAQTVAVAPSRAGALASLIAGGAIHPGDTLSHVQVRKGGRFTATVESDGWIVTSAGRYREPSPALGELVGTSIDGWAYWTHDRSGKTLRKLREENGGAGRGGR